jgi:hypothetical protein
MLLWFLACCGQEQCVNDVYVYESMSTYLEIFRFRLVEMYNVPRNSSCSPQNHSYLRVTTPYLLQFGLLIIPNAQLE